MNCTILSAITTTIVLGVILFQLGSGLGKETSTPRLRKLEWEQLRLRIKCKFNESCIDEIRTDGLATEYIDGFDFPPHDDNNNEGPLD